MKKIIFLIVILASVLMLNLFLRNAHMKHIESSINNIQKELSDIGMTLGISKMNPVGQFFWDVELETEVEIYGTTSDCILYFYIPIVKVHSVINVSKEVNVDIIFPDKITGHLDLNSEVAAKINLEKKYKIFLKSENIPIANIKKDSFDGNNFFKLDLDNVEIDIQSNKPRDKLALMKSISIVSEDLSQEKTKLNTKVHDLNIYLDPERFGKNLPKTISFDDGSKNIEWELDLLITDNLTQDNTPETVYNGNMACITRAFEIIVDGEDRVLKPKNDRNTHKSDLNFNIKNFDIFMDYSTSLMLNSKESELERTQLIEVSNLFRQIVKQNATQNGDITSFKIKDTEDKQTLFQGLPIHQVFKEPIEKLQEYN